MVWDILTGNVLYNFETQNRRRFDGPSDIYSEHVRFNMKGNIATRSCSGDSDHIPHVGYAVFEVFDLQSNELVYLYKIDESTKDEFELEKKKLMKSTHGGVSLILGNAFEHLRNKEIEDGTFEYKNRETWIHSQDRTYAVISPHNNHTLEIRKI